VKIIVSIAMIAVALAAPDLRAASPSHCGALEGRDYTSSENRAYLGIVEEYHFTPNIEALRSGNTGTIGGDLSYTLVQFPNHPRALAAFANLSLRDKRLKPDGARFSVECFFDRAIRFKPTDGIVRMVYGNYLMKAGQPDKATEQLQMAADLQPDNPTINYNLGLLYMQRKDYERARIYAKKAYELDFPLPGLKNQLIKAGKWEE
jgi:tetratricopeptide (TPR) repeat protein